MNCPKCNAPQPGNLPYVIDCDACDFRPCEECGKDLNVGTAGFLPLVCADCAAPKIAPADYPACPTCGGRAEGNTCCPPQDQPQVTSPARRAALAAELDRALARGELMG